MFPPSHSKRFGGSEPSFDSLSKSFCDINCKTNYEVIKKEGKNKDYRSKSFIQHTTRFPKIASMYPFLSGVGHNLGLRSHTKSTPHTFPL